MLKNINTFKIITLIIITFIFIWGSLKAECNSTESDNNLYSIQKFEYHKENININLKYPQIKNNVKEFNIINQQIMKSMLTLHINYKDYNVKEFSDINSFIQGIKLYLHEENLSGLEYSSECEVIYSSNNIVTTKSSNYEMVIHAANGVNTLIYQNFDLQTGKKIVLNDCFAKSNWLQLEKIGKDYFIKKHKDNLKILDTKFLDKFYLPDNFGIKVDGIDFIYQQYEIGPRNIGMPDFLLPNEDIEKLIDKNSLLYQYLYKNK